MNWRETDVKFRLDFCFYVLIVVQKSIRLDPFSNSTPLVLAQKSDRVQHRPVRLALRRHVPGGIAREGVWKNRHV